MTQRKKINSARVNAVISILFHSVALGAIFFFAGREGMLGKRLKEITVSIAPKEKKPEPAKPKPAEPKVETPKVAENKPSNVPPPPRNLPAPPPTTEAPPPAAPPSVDLPAFVFNDGAKDVATTTDPIEIYKGTIEHAVRSRWNRPEDIRDENYIADVEVTLNQNGAITHWDWVKGSGDKRWDDSVKLAMSQTKGVNRPPPKGFPTRFTVRFDVDAAAQGSVPQLSSR
jgi:hypothetical protein